MATPDPADYEISDFTTIKEWQRELEEQAKIRPATSSWWLRPGNRRKNGLDKAIVEINGRIFIIRPLFKEWFLSKRLAA
jgi:hypothetical protein